VSFSPDGSELATADFDGFVNTWEWGAEGTAEPPTSRSPIHVSEVEVNSMAWSPDGSYIATSGGETLRLYDPKTGRQIGSSVPASRLLPYVVFAPDGSKVVAADADAHVWVLPVALDAWEERACEVANRNFTPDEWDEFVTGRAFEEVCG